jgi:hypothetical protein
MTKTVGQYSCDNVRLNKKIEIFCQRFGVRGLIETAGIDSAVSLRPRNLWQKCLCPIPRSHWDRGIGVRGLIETAESGVRGLIETAESDSAVSMRPQNRNFAHDYLEFLGENEAICKKALGHESEP